MPKLKWDELGKRFFETGTKNGVLFTTDDEGTYETGVPWNGLTAVNQSPDGGEETPLYADNIKYLSLYSVEEFKGSIEAYTYPDEFGKCDGSAEIVPGVNVGQQGRSLFGMCYTTQVGNDVQGADFGEKIHVIWAARVSPSDRSYETINDTPDAITFSWDFNSTAQEVEIEGIKPTAYVSVDSTKVSKEVFQTAKDTLHGTAEKDSELPSVTEFIKLLQSAGGTESGN